MENQLSQEENISPNLRRVGKIVFILYLIIPYIFFFYGVLQHPYLLLDYLRWLTSDWFNPLRINIYIFLYWSPILFTIAGMSYIARMSKISRIPSNTSLYDAITLPTIQYGPLKIIFPVLEDERFEENEI
ncbi:MAG: hypothetical protein ACW991_09515 [Candidatus Hodarchaeales archaeon]|jgi:hypothetical protein